MIDKFYQAVGAGVLMFTFVVLPLWVLTYGVMDQMAQRG